MKRILLSGILSVFMLGAAFAATSVKFTFQNAQFRDASGQVVATGTVQACAAAGGARSAENNLRQDPPRGVAANGKPSFYRQGTPACRARKSSPRLTMSAPAPRRDTRLRRARLPFAFTE